MSIIKYLKLRFLTRKIHSILNSWSGWDYSVTRQYDIDKVPLPSELKSLAILAISEGILNVAGIISFIISLLISKDDLVAFLNQFPVF